MNNKEYGLIAILGIIIFFSIIGATIAAASGQLVFTFDDTNSLESNALTFETLTSNGQRGVFYVVTDDVTEATMAQYWEYYAYGWDISCHTMTHAHLNQISDTEIAAELNGCRNWLETNGFSKSAKFLAYPYGDFDQRTIDIAKSTGFLSARTVWDGFENSDTIIGNYEVNAFGIKSTTSIEFILSQIEWAAANDKTIVLFMHRITKIDPAPEEYSNSQLYLKQISDYAATSGIKVITFSDLLTTPTPSPTPTVTSTTTPTATETPAPILANLIKNPGFESGITSWKYYTNGAGLFSIISPGYNENKAAKIAISKAGTNVQLYQMEINLQPNTSYRLSFAAYSNTGHDMTVRLFKHVSPFTAYAPDFKANLGTNWQIFSTEFTTPDFTGTVNDARLMFWLVPYAIPGDVYYFDDIRIEKK